MVHDKKKIHTHTHNKTAVLPGLKSIHGVTNTENTNTENTCPIFGTLYAIIRQPSPFLDDELGKNFRLVFG
jgi:hypothetical protein